MEDGKDADRDAAAAEMPGRALATVDAHETKTIVVNGRRIPYTGSEIGHAELGRLAFPDASAAEGRALTIAYDHGPATAPSGLIGTDRPVRVLDGQTFDVYLTSKS